MQRRSCNCNYPQVFPVKQRHQHSSKEVNELSTITWSSKFSSRAVPVPREPRPVRFEPGSMPANHGFRLYEDQHTLPTRPESPQHHPEQLVRTCKPRLRSPRFQNSKLLPQSQVFQQKITTRTDRPNQQNKQEPHQAQHTISLITERRQYKYIAISASHNFRHTRAEP